MKSKEKAAKTRIIELEQKKYMLAHVLEERGLEWKKEWTGSGGGAPHNGITKACYRGSNAFWLSLVSMMKGYTDPRWVTMIQIMDNDGKYHPKEKWHLKAGSKATYVEYWYPYDLENKKALYSVLFIISRIRLNRTVLHSLTA